MLRYSVRGENIEVTEVSRGHVEKHLEKPERYFELTSSITAHVNLKAYKNHNAKVEVTISLPYLVLRAEETSGDMYRGTDFVSDEPEHRVRKYKTRVNRKGREKGAKDSLIETPAEGKKPTSEPDIIRNRRVSLKPMDPEEVILQTDMLKHDFFVFQDAETNGTSIVYRRNDGHYGLIETSE